MSQLAYNYKGQRFAPPSQVMFGRVRRLREGQRGQLDVVRGADGRPLIVPIDIDVDGFRVAVNDQVGRYRLDALDEHEMLLPDVDAAYVTVPTPASREEVEETEMRDVPMAEAAPAAMMRNAAVAPAWAPPATVTAPFGTWPALPMPVAMTGTEYLLAEALRGQVQMFQMVTAALANQGATASAGAAQMMGAAAELVRAADGAAMPRRPPPPAPVAPTPSGGPSATLPPIVVAAPGSFAARNAAPMSGDGWDDGDGDEDDGDEEEVGPTGDDADMFAKIMTLADKVQGVIAPVADVARMVMGGRDGGVRNAAPAEPSACEAGAEAPEETAEAPEVAHLRASHILLIAYELGPDGALFRRVLMTMEPEDRRAWTEHLCSMELEDAVADAAAKLARLKRRQDARRADPSGRAREAQVDNRRGTECEDGGGDDADGEADRPRHQDGSDRDLIPDGDQPSGDEDESVVSGDAETDVDAPAPDADEVDGAHATNEAGGQDSAPATMPTSPSTGNVTASAPSGPAVQARMMEIARHLRVPEILRAQKMIAEIAGAERNAWIVRLMAMTPAEAAQVIRTELARRSAP